MTLSIPDYIRYRHSRMGQIDGIFVHETVQGIKYVFFYFTPILPHTWRLDSILNLSIHKLDRTRQEIVGLPAVESLRLYMIDISPSNSEGLQLGNDELLYCSWNIEFF